MPWLLVVGCYEQSSRHNFPHPGHVSCCSAPSSRPPATKALHTICGNNTSIVSRCWWWAYKCPRHVEQIISAIKHSTVSSWFSSLRLHKRGIFRMFPESIYLWEIKRVRLFQLNFLQTKTLVQPYTLETILEAILRKPFQLFLRILDDVSSIISHLFNVDFSWEGR